MCSVDSDKGDPGVARDGVSGPATISAGGERPRVWPAFVVFAVAVGSAIAAQIAAVIVLVATHVAEGGEPDPEAIRQLTESVFLSPVGFMLLAGFGQLAFLASVLVATRLLPGRRVEQLGLKRPRLPARTYIALIAGTGVPVAIGVGLSSLLSLLFEPLTDPERLWSGITPLTFVPYVLFISLAPGFVEEITFRGFIQRRLMQRWSPRAAIAWSALLFALAHMDPHSAVFVLPLGVWLGVIAWRIGVIWPCIACHAVLNGLWSVYFIGTVNATPSTAFHAVSAVVVGAVSAVGFVASLRILFSRDEALTRVAGGTGR